MDTSRAPRRGGVRTESVGIYVRISSNPDGEHVGVQRQEEDCRKRCEAEGWRVHDLYRDDNVSAWAGAARPEYERLCEDIRRGEVTRIVCWQIDRLTRSTRDLDDLIDLDVPVTVLTNSGIDLSSDGGRAVARTLAAWARYESDVKATRVRRAHEHLARAGAWTGQRCFGYEADGTVILDEAAVIRTLADRFLAGESLRSLTIWLNDTGVPTVRGGRWRTTTLRAILPAARLSAQREHTPRTEGRGYGMGEIVGEGAWEAILTPEQTARIRARLSDPSRRTSVTRVHLLSGGILRCGRCRSPMNRRSDPRSGDRYQCIRLPGTDRCGSMSIVAEPTEEWVKDVILKALMDAVDASPTPSQQNDEEDRARAIDDLAEVADLREFSDYQLTQGRMTRSRWIEMNAELDKRETRARAVLATPAQVAVKTLTKGWTSLDAWWRESTVDQRRAAIMALTDGIICRPALRRGYPRFVSGRLFVEWRR